MRNLLAGNAKAGWRLVLCSKKYTIAQMFIIDIRRALHQPAFFQTSGLREWSSDLSPAFIQTVCSWIFGCPGTGETHG